MEELKTPEYLKNTVEGFDESKIKRNPIDEHWQEVYTAVQNQTILQAELIGIDKEGKEIVGLIQYGTIRGMIPLKLSGVEKEEQLKQYLGRRIAFKVINYDRSANIFTGSRQAALEQMASMTWNRMELDQQLYAVVRDVNINRIKVDIGGIEVALKADELSYEWIDVLEEKYNVGDHLSVKIVELDKEKKHVKVSHKATMKNPYPDCLTRYQKGQTRVGTVTGVVEYGVFVNLESGVDILCRHMKIGKVSKHDRVAITIVTIDEKKQKMYGKISQKI
ncbi:S1 RNA-binding domain-containing protein [Paenibacillus agricola]|uniref:30S ribosomal protein S1 n=1 Tax=Paenibacillus agricola TaxID=2716264 RepID=A0ABX0JJX9_9BACL|nr:S1 RNA-binding domain-containing protein [Paenibacillus agricola]NHN34869.1 30S ribosomal protein S1 [Paenibacillus agricola]